MAISTSSMLTPGLSFTVLNSILAPKGMEMASNIGLSWMAGSVSRLSFNIAKERRAGDERAVAMVQFGGSGLRIATRFPWRGAMTEISRRNWLLRSAASGAAVALGMARLRRALAADSVQKGIARLRGEVRIGDLPAKQGMEIRPGDVITTGAGAEIVFVVGRDAFMARSGSRVELSGTASQAVI